MISIFLHFVLQKLLLRNSQFKRLDADRQGATLILWRSFKQEGVCTLQSIWVGLGWSRTGQGSLDHDVQWDGSGALGRVSGGAWWVKQHGNGLRKWVWVRVLMVEVVGVYVLAGRRRWHMGWQRWRGRRWRELKAHREGDVVLYRKYWGIDGMTRCRGVFRVTLGDGGRPFRRHWWGGLGWHKTGSPRGLGEVTCRWKKNSL